MLWKATVFGILLFIGGCQLLTRSPVDEPLLESDDKGITLTGTKGFDAEGRLIPDRYQGVAGIRAVAVTPERRMVFIDIDQYGNSRFCAESPTEVGQNNSKLANLTASIKPNDTSSAALAALVASQTSDVAFNPRSQAVQLFMAESYNLCQLYLNSGMPNEEYIALQFKALEAIVPVLGEELPLLYAHEQQKQADLERKKQKDRALVKCLLDANPIPASSTANGVVKAPNPETGVAASAVKLRKTIDCMDIVEASTPKSDTTPAPNAGTMGVPMTSTKVGPPAASTNVASKRTLHKKKKGNNTSGPSAATPSPASSTK